MLPMIAEMQLKLDTISENIAKLETDKEERRKSASDEIEAIETKLKTSIAGIDELIKELTIESSNISYSISMVNAVAAYYEDKAEEKLANDTTAAEELLEADKTGGIEPADWVKFCSATSISPSGIELPREPAPDEEGEPEAALEEPVES